MEIMRLAIAGPVSSGKSTFIRSVSEIEVVDTDRKATDETAKLKQNTTVAFDFGRLQFGPNQVLHLYGTPGQSRFDFMWDLIIRKAHAYILLVAAHRPHEFRYTRGIISFMKQRADIPMIIGVTHTDSPEAWSKENVMIALGYYSNNSPPALIVDPRDRGSAAQALLGLLQHSMKVGIKL
ncbi:GTP-binding protein [Calothrix rhizosoleniae]|uniref:GTP-binding protein n=1 Tax=Calothrix rhizosoleniae TaxID=888997 RepID=UPI000B4A3C50|nr:ATP/GTP-binding protein [Calothrix rhizosoleniae]